MTRYAAALAIMGFVGATSLLAGGKSANVVVHDAGGNQVGTAQITEAKRGGILIRLKVRGLPLGDHAAHIHEQPKCEGPDFASAGGHFNPEKKQHGLENPDGPHGGDLVNFNVAGKKRKANVLLVNTHLNLNDGPNSVFTNGGTSLVIDAGVDDMKTDPSGKSGVHIACGVITK
ncbi:MAG: superoxide dismutase family protein [Bryobacteraceae bacterium]